MSEAHPLAEVEIDGDDYIIFLMVCGFTVA